MTRALHRATSLLAAIALASCASAQTSATEAAPQYAADQIIAKGPNPAWSDEAFATGRSTFVFDDWAGTALTVHANVLTGHSAGSQFVHRLMFLKPEARARRIVAANAGWYTMPELAMKQGPHRFARGQSFFAAARDLAGEKGWAFGWKQRIVPGVAHSNGEMSRSDRIGPWP